MPKISVIIPVYNAEKFLRATLNSLLSQSYTDIEILCVNDGSTDGSKNILMEYASKDPRVKYYNQKNKGMSAARNLGLDKASGDFIFLMDADDLLAQNAFEVLLTNIKDADFCACGVEGVYNDTDTAIPTPKDYRVTGYKISPYNFRKVQTAIAIVVWNKLYRASFLKNIRFTETIRQSEDVIFVFNVMTQANSCTVITAPLYGYRLHQNQTTRIEPNKKIPDMQDGALELSKQIKAYLANNKVPFILKNYLLKKAARAIFRSFAAKTGGASYELQQESLKKLIVLHNNGDFNITDLGIKEMWRLLLIAYKNHIVFELFFRYGK